MIIWAIGFPLLCFGFMLAMRLSFGKPNLELGVDTDANGRRG